MTIFIILSAILFLVSSGSMKKHRRQNEDSMLESSLLGKLLLSFLTLLPFIMLIVSVSTLFDLKWYWALLISYVGTMFLGNAISSLYSVFFGYKSKPYLNLLEGKWNFRDNLYIIDALITFVLGIILYLIA